MAKPSLSGYSGVDHYDEMFDQSGLPREHYAAFWELLQDMGNKRLQQLKHSTDKTQVSMGMTFNVYHDNQGVEKILPLDIVPRIINGAEWDRIERGLKQRIEALNLFIHDLYHDQRILKEKVIPEELVLGSKDYLEACKGLRPPKDIWVHISGSDIVRDKAGEFYVLEDNLRCPSGVSYLLENREIIKQAYPGFLSQLGVRPVQSYSTMLLKMLQYISGKNQPTVGVLTPGMFNSAYFEHSYLATQMGVPLVSGTDLIVENDHVYMQTTEGLQPVDVLYRRIDDTFLDPLAFNPDSMLGVPGLFEAYRQGKVALANAPGTGVADDKAVYTYLPEIIKFYMDQDPIINNVPTYKCRNADERAYVLDHLPELVVKETNAAGGYGMMIGPQVDSDVHAQFAELIKKNPNNYIAQPTLSLSTVPTLTKQGLAPRHVDLRPYIIYGENIEVLPGALTRVALKEGSLVVNSSQGGGSKDTWVLY